MSRRSREVLILVIVFAGVLLLSVFVVYFVSGGRRTTSDTARQPDAVLQRAGESPSPVPESPANENFIDQLFGTQHAEPHLIGDSWPQIMGRIFLRLLLAAFLGAALAFRPRKHILALKRNPYVSQTQILLAIVAAALMIIVGDNAARAFGIFAAVSLVRFRTNIRDPKEITVLLISLALGLAAGVGRWDLAVILALFSLVVLWLLEWREPQMVFRSMELTVRTYNTDAMQETLKQVFQHHGLNAELRQIDPPDEKEPMGCIMYFVNMNLTVSTDRISEEIRTLNPNNVDSIEWEQKKDSSYIYQ